MKPKSNYSKIILIISILVVIILLSFISYQFSTFNFPENYTLNDKIYEYITLLFHLPFLIPALVGTFASKKIGDSLVVISCYVIYLLICILSYSSIFWATDPLEVGFLFVNLAIPFSLIFSIYLFYLLKLRNKLACIKPSS